MSDAFPSRKTDQFELLRSTLGKGIALLALVCLPLVLSDYEQYVANLVLVYVVVSVGFNIVLGYVGQLAFANAAFFGVGAYTVAFLMRHWHFPFLLALLLAVLAAGFIGAVVSVTALRMRGFYLAIATLAFGELLRWLYVHGGPITNGSSGLAVPAVSVFDLPVDTDQAKYYLFLALTVLVLWSTANLLRSRFGRALIAVRENEPAAESVGINSAWAVVFAFIWSGAVAGLAGAMFAVLLGRISPDNFDLSQLLLQFTIVIIGGLGSLFGSVVGAALISALPELLLNIPGMEEIVFGLLLIIILLFLPRGLAGLAERIAPWLRDRYVQE